MNTKMWVMLLGMSVTVSALAATNAVPTVQIVSAGMRAGTTLMDVVYKITDVDDATVMVRALAFMDGVRSFANVIRPVTFVENTQTNIGDSITTGVNHTLTWDVRADWSVDLANMKFEVLCRDSRGLLPLNWITIPAMTNSPAVTISSNVPTDAQVMDALFWLYSDADPQLVLTNGNLTGTSASDCFESLVIAVGASVQRIAPAFVFKQMNLDMATLEEADIAVAARSGVSDHDGVRVVPRVWNSGLTHGGDVTAIKQVGLSPRWVMNRYADSAITMSDRVSGLMWFYYPRASGNMTWSSASAYCANLTYAGYHDWGLPGGELSDLYAQQGFFPDVSKGAGSSFNGGYWSRNPYNSWPYGYLLFYFPDHKWVYRPDDTSVGVWPVRSSQ